MEVSIHVEGLDRIERGTEAARKAISEELAKAMQASMLRVEREAKQSILNGQKSGRLYKFGNVFHRASAPGEAPASNTGRLVNSIRGRVDTSALKQGRLEGTVSVNVSYGRPLEFGTSKMAARPFLFPALEKSKEWIRERLNKAVRDGVIRVVKNK